MKFIIFNSLVLAQGLNKLINDYMINTIPGYNATKWCDILTDNNGKFAISVKDIDPRIPSNALNNTTKNKLVNILPDEFYHISVDGIKTFNYFEI